MQVFRKGSRGSAVSDIQSRLLKLGYDLGQTGADGVFGDSTEVAVREFQKDRGITCDGVVGDETWQELVEATYELGDRLLYLKAPFFRGDDVRKLQNWLNTLGFSVGPVDGIFGPSTEKQVREFQKNTGLTPDGIVGRATLEALQGLRNIFEAEGKVEFPQELSKKPSPISVFKGKKIVVDCEKTSSLECDSSEGKLKREEICYDLGLRLGNLFELLGARALYTWKERELDAKKRAPFANMVGADLLVSFRLGASKDSSIKGAATYYHKQGSKYSKFSKKLAAAIQKELVVSLKQADRGTHGKNIPMLKAVNVTAVQVEPAVLTCKEDRELLSDETFRQKIAVAVFDGVKNCL